jgi:spermidine synthase
MSAARESDSAASIALALDAANMANHAANVSTAGDTDAARASAALRAARVSVAATATLLFCSGACALIYQTVWLREFRLVFGASTAASAAVLAIFMGGLGVGSAWFGQRADRARTPLAYYGWLETGIALSAAATPALGELARVLYFGAGGSPQLGIGVATVLRLGLSSLVLLLPAILMGGTLPAASRAVVNAADTGRRYLALLYGTNALGAMTGALLSTFVLLERFGNRHTLWMACALNLLVAATAWWLSRRAMGRAALDNTPERVATTCDSAVPPARAPAESVGTAAVEAAAPSPASSTPAWIVYAAACLVGCAFLLMELVWYRMLGPLLGGSVYTFGTILAFALLGIGAGSMAYTLWSRHLRASLEALALTCSLEALFLALPFFAGDRLAFFDLELRALVRHGFAAQVGAWVVVTGLVVVPPALVSGFQFPLLIALLGRGDEALGRQAGRTYAWNTLGAIVGSLAGGFGLLPQVSAPGTWRATAATLALMSLLLGFLAPARRAGRVLAVASVAVASLTCVLLTSRGPGAAWRHAGIGAGRTDFLIGAPAPVLEDQARTWERNLIWEVDGTESSVGLMNLQSHAFIVNGKNDGSARGDAATFIMLAMTGALLHPDPRSAFIVGLGTGDSVGWLARVAGMREVDVVELEPAVLEVAKISAPVNAAALDNPKVHLMYGDAREHLLARRDRYDLIMSNPSNPYRAGVASLLTAEFYRAAAQRLNDGGLFLQWVQSYEVTAETVHNIYATLVGTFPDVETWETEAGDMLFVASRRLPAYDARSLRERIRQEPYRTVLRNAWRVDTLEGLLGHYASGTAMARELARDPANRLNTDDRTGIEFAFARSVGSKTGFDPRPDPARRTLPGYGRPTGNFDGVDWDMVERHRDISRLQFGALPAEHAEAFGARAARIRVFADFLQGTGNLGVAAEHWRVEPFEPVDWTETALVAELSAEAADDRAAGYAARLRTFQPIEADVVDARLAFRQGRADAAVQALQRAFMAYRRDPWPWPQMMVRALILAQEIAGRTGDARLGAALYDALDEPFAVAMWDDFRRHAMVSVARGIGDQARLARAVARFEPHVPWDLDFLTVRAESYRATGEPRAEAAERDRVRYLEQAARYAR